MSIGQRSQRVHQVSASRSASRGVGADAQRNREIKDQTLNQREDSYHNDEPVPLGQVRLHAKLNTQRQSEHGPVRKRSSHGGQQQATTEPQSQALQSVFTNRQTIKTNSSSRQKKQSRSRSRGMRTFGKRDGSQSAQMQYPRNISTDHGSVTLEQQDIEG